MIPRPYQVEALAALHDHVCTKDTNPCVVIPTGGGKSALMAWIIKKWKSDSPWLRVIVLAHRKELIEQNAKEFQDLCMLDKGSVGVFSAALKRRDYDADVLFASIDSVYKRTGDFTPWDVIFVDEAHRIPPAGEGKYLTFIKGSRRFNEQLKVVGWTATPYRMGCGQICHPDHILNEICYEARVTDLINDGFLCNLRSKVSVIQPDLERVKRSSGGDYIINSLAKVTSQQKLVSEATAEAVRIIKAEKRKSVLFFCVNVSHANLVSDYLHHYGVYAPVVTCKTKPFDRHRISEDFKSGKLNAVCNVNVFTEGFNATRIDCIVLLRPTLSTGLFSQMVGRGLRLHVGKLECLVLDFAGCIEEHGPVDLLGGRPVVMAICGRCRESFSRAVRKCPQCGWEISKIEVERLATKEQAKRRMHGRKSSKRAILSTEPETFKVDDIFIGRHRKEGSPDSLRVQYRCGLSQFSEWICLDHPNYPGVAAQRWWQKRFNTKIGHITTVNAALEDLFVLQTLREWTKTITVRRNGKYFSIIGYNQPLSHDV